MTTITARYADEAGRFVEATIDGQIAVVPLAAESGGPAGEAVRAWIAAGNTPDGYQAPTPTAAAIDGVTFLARFTDDEYLAITAAGRTNGQIGKWIEMLRLRGEIDVSGTTAQAAKTGVVAAGLLTQERADEIFAV